MCTRISNSLRQIERPTTTQKPTAPQSQPTTQSAAVPPQRQNQNSSAQLRNTSKAQMNPVAGNLNFSGGSVTRETLMGALAKSDLGSKLSSPANKKTFEKIADKCIEIGKKENVDPRLLFAMAMQESDCGLSLTHAGSATGAMGIMPGALKSVLADKTLSKGLEGTKLSELKNNHDKSITVAARYLKVAAREFEANTKGNTGVSSADLAPGNLSTKTWSILAAYRHGSGAAAKDYNADGVINKGYEKDFQDYLKLLNVKIK